MLAGGSDFDGDDMVTDGAIIEAYELYKNPEEIDVNIFIDGNKSEDVKRNLVTICESRLDSMLVADVLYSHVVKNKGQESTDMVN